MDQLKVILKHVQKHHFWILCVLAAVISLTGWMMARGTLSAKYDQRKGAVLGKFSALDSIRSVDPHPNGQWTEAINKLTEEERKKVATAWETVYSEQKELLKWPESLGPDFLKAISENPQALSNIEWRGIYHSAILKEIPKLAEIVGAEPVNPSQPSTRPASGASAAAPAANAGDAPAKDYKVTWASENQMQVRGLFEWPTTPSEAQVRMAQEDLWVYTAVLNILRATNEGAEYVPRLKTINTILIGKPAAEEFAAGMRAGIVEKLQVAGGGEDPAAAGGAAAAPEAPAEEGAEKPIDEGRYVDADGKPLPSGTEQLQFKRLPVYLRVVMDQREINRLLVECANSPLPLEVRQLRINASAADSGPRQTTNRSQSSGSGEPAEAEGYDVPVELHGIIYMYNPPELQKLGGAEPNATADASFSPPGGPRRRGRMR